MAEEKEDKRPFWMKARWQGLGIMALGFLCLANPVTAPYATIVISTGAGWSSGGTISKIARDKTQ